MKKSRTFVLILMAFLAMVFGFVNMRPTPVQADGLIPWTGNGSDNLPCSGGHWVLAPADGITGAILHVNGSDYTMSQNGNGSWSADSSGPLDSSLSASVSYTGPGDARNHLQLSHCIGTETPPTETPPTETPPTETVTETPPTETPPTETPPTVTVTPPTETPPTETVTETPPTVTVTPPTETPVPTTPVPYEPPTGTPESVLPVTGADFGTGSNLPFFGTMILGGIGMLVAALRKK